MNRAKTITLTVLLFLFAANLPCSACWDDDDDDWYDYWDDDWWDDDDDYAWWIDLPEVVITPEHDDDYGSDNDDDDDWWRRDYDDDSWDDNNDDYDEDNDIIVGYEGESHSDSNNRIYLSQSCQLCCVPAVMANMMMYAKHLTLEQAERLQEQYKNKYKEIYNKDVKETGVNNTEIKEFMRECGFDVRSCTIESVPICLDNGGQVFVFIDITTEYGDNYGHALDIIDYQKDSKGNVVSYECINPNTGKVEVHYPNEFMHPQNIYCIIIK